MKELKELLFKKCSEECEKYQSLPHGHITKEDPVEALEKDAVKEQARQRFIALYALIEDADIEDEYEEWKRTYTL